MQIWKDTYPIERDTAMISEIETSETLYPRCGDADTRNPIGEITRKTIVVYSPSMDFCVSMRILLENQCAVFTTTDSQLFLTFARTIRPDFLIVDAYPSSQLRKCFEMVKREQPRIGILLILPSRLSERKNLGDFRLLVDGLLEEPVTLRVMKKTLTELMHE